MKRYAKILPLTALTAVLFSASACSLDLKKNYVTTTQSVEESFSNVSLSTSAEDVVFLPSLDGECKVVSYGHKNMRHDVSVEEDTLIISLVDERAWYDKIITVAEFNVTVYLPQGEYNSLSAQARTGDIRLASDFTFTNIDLSVTTGDIKCYASATETTKLHATTGDVIASEITTGNLTATCSTGYVTLSSIACAGEIKVQTTTGNKRLTNVNCDTLTLKGSTGDCSLSNVVAAQKLSVENSTGDVRFEDCDAAEVYVKTSTGDVEGYFLTDKTFDAHSNTGKVSVPQSKNGGWCEIRVGTGDILFTAPTNE